MAVRVTYEKHGSASGGASEDVHVGCGSWDVSGGVLVLYDAQTKRVKAAYGAHHWIKAEFVKDEDVAHNT
jgi:hypothetical protein